MTQWIQLYPDGSCHWGTKGGWACVFDFRGVRKVLMGSSRDTSSNKMEMTAVIEGLNHIRKSAMVAVYSDSQYVVNGFNQWLPNWKKNKWRKSNKKPVLNVEYWQKIDLAVKLHDQVIFNWIPGHQGFGLNDVADHYANIAATEQCKRSLIELTDADLNNLPERQ